ncbi:MAG: 2-hydroxyacyl-CoA dehydratase family protein [Pseudomonadota bacterium]
MAGDPTGKKDREEPRGDVLFRHYYRPALNALMDDYNRRLAELESHRDQPVAWITTLVPIEILNAAGIFPFYPENYSALCAARGVSKELIRIAVSSGLSRDLCGYATCNVGSVLSDQGAFGKGGIPRPDLLITTRLACNLHVTWWTYLSRFFKVPLFILDAPYRSGGQYKDFDIQYFISQIKRLIRFIEEKTGRQIKRDKLSEIMALSDQASLFWSEISLSRRAVPSPLGSKDVFSLMFPMVTLAGRPEAVTFYRDVSKEVKRRVALGKGEAKKENYRLIWDKFPPWHDMKLWNYFDEVGAVFVFDFYADAFSGRLKNSDPYMALVDKYLNNPTTQRGIEDLKKNVERIAKEFALDGAVFMSNRACRYFSLGQLDLSSYIRDELKLPVLIFEGDHMDPNQYSRENILEHIGTFLGLLSDRR